MSPTCVSTVGTARLDAAGEPDPAYGGGDGFASFEIAEGLTEVDLQVTPSRYILEFGAIPSDERVVVDGNVITGGGVTAGIDFALTIVAELHGEAAAQALKAMTSTSMWLSAIRNFSSLLNPISAVPIQMFTRL